MANSSRPPKGTQNPEVLMTEPNVGEHLYYRGMKRAETCRKKTLEKAHSLSELKNKNYTFRPKINLSTNKKMKIVQLGHDTSQKYMLTSHGTSRVEERLWNEGLKNKEKQNVRSRAYEEFQRQLCSFTPKVNKISEQIIKTKRIMDSNLGHQNVSQQDKNGFLYNLSKQTDVKLQKLTEGNFSDLNMARSSEVNLYFPAVNQCAARGHGFSAQHGDLVR